MENKNINENEKINAEETNNVQTASAVEKKKNLPLIIGAAAGGVVVIVGIVLAIVLLGGKKDPEPQPDACAHLDKNDDFVCDTCGEEYDDGIEKTACTFTVVDSDGNKIEGASFTLKRGSVTNTLTSGAGGVASCDLVAGEYSVEFDYDTIPSGFQPSVFSVEVKKDSTSFELILVDNNPNGTADRPYYISENETPLALLADAEVYYNIRGGAGKTLSIACADVTVKFNGETYEPIDGVISIYIDSEVDAMNAFSVKNNSNRDLDIVINLVSPLGSMDNPIEMTENTLTVAAYVGTSVWYKWTAASAGVVFVGSSNSRNNISLINETSSAVSESTEGSLGEYMMVSEGDVVLISLSAMSSRDDESLTVDIEFSVKLYAGTESDPIPVVKNSFGLSLKTGAALVFSLENGGVLSIADTDITVVYNGDTYSPSKLGIVMVTLEDGAIFTINNTSESSNGIDVKIN